MTDPTGQAAPAQASQTPAHTGPPGVLSGIRVLELGQVLAGPFAGAIFADLGAEVVKLERTDGGDDARHMGPPFRHGDALNFQVFNRGKQSVALDLKTDAGRPPSSAWPPSADVFIHNLRPGVPGAGHRRAVAVRAPPRLVYCAISAFGAPAGRWRCGPATSR
jgi:crotonobetainyl-CoA:carnitine CoA-transferase CaiB-like acyl-CoA transferase